MSNTDRLTPTRIIRDPSAFRKCQNKRVAVYARVSSDKDEAKNSLKNQIAFFSSEIAKHPDWELAGIYQDQGKSGTNDRRAGFRKMVDDCRAGKIDVIMVKSVDRLARNTPLLLKFLTGARDNGVTVYFLQEGLNSSDQYRWTDINAASRQAAFQAKTISDSQSWRIKNDFKNGRPRTCNTLGYKLRRGKIVIVKQEAKIVRKIFDWALDGKSAYAIAKHLRTTKYCNGQGNKWTHSGVIKILRNDMYIGDLSMQKTFREDCVSKNSKINRGERDKYLIKNHHEPIVTREEFAKVNKLLESRRCVPKSQTPKDEKSSLVGLVRCGVCDHSYGLSNGYWRCRMYTTYGRKACSGQSIPDKILREKLTGLVKEDIPIKSQISRINILPDHKIEVVFLDWRKQIIEWEYRSRKETWAEKKSTNNNSKENNNGNNRK